MRAVVATRLVSSSSPVVAGVVRDLYRAGMFDVPVDVVVVVSGASPDIVTVVVGKDCCVPRGGQPQGRRENDDEKDVDD